jgi:hypothetical protein
VRVPSWVHADGVRPGWVRRGSSERDFVHCDVHRAELLCAGRNFRGPDVLRGAVDRHSVHRVRAVRV